MTTSPVACLPKWAIRPVERLARIHGRRLAERLASDPTVPAEIGDTPLRALAELFRGLPEVLLGDPPRARSAFVWMVERYLDGGIRLFEDACGEDSRAGRALAFWASRKNRANYGLPDRLDGFPDLLSLAKVTTHRDTEAGSRLPPASVGKAMSIPSVASGTKVVHDSDRSLVVQVTNREAAVYWGSGTHWCTVPNETICNRYLTAGPLYILFDKEENEKYQLHFPTGQFTDSDDRSASFSVLCRLFPNVRDFADDAGWTSMVVTAWRRYQLHDVSLPDDVLRHPEVVCDQYVLEHLAHGVDDGLLRTLVGLPHGPWLIPTLLMFRGNMAETALVAIVFARLLRIGAMPDGALPGLLRFVDRYVEQVHWPSASETEALTMLCVPLLRCRTLSRDRREMLLDVLDRIGRNTGGVYEFLVQVGPEDEVPDRILVNCFTENERAERVFAEMVVDGGSDCIPVVRRMLDNNCFPSLSPIAVMTSTRLCVGLFTSFEPEWAAGALKRANGINPDFSAAVVTHLLEFVGCAIDGGEEYDQPTSHKALDILRALPPPDRVSIARRIPVGFVRPEAAASWRHWLGSRLPSVDPELAADFLRGAGPEVAV